MPVTPPRPCRHPACASLVAGGNGYCPHHQHDASQHWRNAEANRMADATLAAVKRFRSSAAWRKLSRLYLAQHPLCCDPFADHAREGIGTALASQVHHVVPLAQRMDLGLTWDNLRSLCTRCHRRVEAIERTGEGTQRLFDANAQQSPAFIA